MKSALYIFFAIIFISCLNKPETFKDNMYKNTTEALFEGIDYVILSKNDEWVKNRFKNFSEGELTTDDLEQINEILNFAVENYNKKMEKDIILSRYKRQYIAFFNKNGEKEVWVNCFNSKHIENANYWKTEVVVVMDGGNNFFQLIINLSKTTYYDFWVNGYA
jgi:hypothetical protein